MIKHITFKVQHLMYDHERKYVRFVVNYKKVLASLCTDGFFVAGLNLTADRCFIASNPHVSLQTITLKQWECVRRWLEDQKPGAASSSLNIIAGDFIGMIPLCSIIIALNNLLLKHRGT